MLGMVFREFLDLVEQKFGSDAVDDVIEAAQVASGGAYTTVGNYPHGEMIALVLALADHTRLPARDLVHAFAEHLMGAFARKHPDLFVGTGDVLDFIEGVDRHIHREVRRLYPDAELPQFACRRTSATELAVEYRSTRHLEELAHGLMLAAAKHFEQTIHVERGPPTEEGRVPFAVRLEAA